MDSNEDVRSIYKLERLGYLKTFGADNGPYIVNVTAAAVEAVASGNIMAERQLKETRMTEINVISNNAPVIIQNDTVGSSQVVGFESVDLNEFARKIIELADSEEFLLAFGEQASLVQTQARAALETKDDGLKKALLGIVRDIAVKVGASVGTTGVLGVFGALADALA